MHLCPTPNQGLRVPMTHIFRTRKDLINQANLHDRNAFAPIHHKRNNDGASPAQSVQPPTVPGAIPDFDQTHHLDTCGELLRLQGHPSPGQTKKTALHVSSHIQGSQGERNGSPWTKLANCSSGSDTTFCRRFFHHVPDHISSHFHNRLASCTVAFGLLGSTTNSVHVLDHQFPTATCCVEELHPRSPVCTAGVGLCHRRENTPLLLLD